MEFSLTTEVQKQIQIIKTKNPEIFRKIQKQLSIFKANHFHPSLRNHKLQGNLEKSWSISINGNLRLLYYISNNKAVFFIIGNHDEVYRK